MLNCMTCKTQPVAGQDYFETACATCSLCSDKHTASCGDVHYEEWMQTPAQYPAAETASQTYLVVSYILSTPEQRAADYDSNERLRAAVNVYVTQFSLAERKLITAMFRLGMRNRNVFSWLASHGGATKQYWHKIWRNMQRRIN